MHSIPGLAVECLESEFRVVEMVETNENSRQSPLCGCGIHWFLLLLGQRANTPHTHGG